MLKTRWSILKVRSIRSATTTEIYFRDYNSGWEPSVELHVVHIYFNTPTFDHITKVSDIIIIYHKLLPDHQDAKTNTMTQISVIGGTLGLFTGFSIMSAVEIIYFIVKSFLGRIERTKKIKKATEP